MWWDLEGAFYRLNFSRDASLSPLPDNLYRLRSDHQ